jgi:hypothetical protein
MNEFVIQISVIGKQGLDNLHNWLYYYYNIRGLKCLPTFYAYKRLYSQHVISLRQLHGRCLAVDRRYDWKRNTGTFLIKSTYDIFI